MQRLALKSSLFCVILIVLSCSEETNVAKVAKDIDVQNGYLVFKDQSTFEATRTRIQSMSNPERESWEAQFSGFASMNTVYNKALQEDEKHHESMGNSSSHSMYYLAHTASLYEDDVDMVTPNLPYDFMDASILINGEGLVKIGTSILELKRETKKEVLTGDESLVAKLSGVTETDQKLGIKVINITNTRLGANSNVRTQFTGPDNCDGYTSGGGQRVRGYITYVNESTQDIYGNFGCAQQGYIWAYRSYIATSAVNQIHSLGAWRNKDTGQLRITGTMHIEHSGGFPVIGDWTIDHGSGGALVSSINYTFYDTGWACSPNPYLTMSGTLYFYGRDGSTCSK